jgi:hypothetical protein
MGDSGCALRVADHQKNDNIPLKKAETRIKIKFQIPSTK